MSQTQSPPQGQSATTTKDKEVEREQAKIKEESSARYRRSIESINRSRDSDIQKALKR
jgi:hypothetical protein